MHHFGKSIKATQDTDEAANAADHYDEDVKALDENGNTMTFNLKVEVRWPDKGQHGACQTSNQPHQDRKVGDRYGHHESKEDHGQPKSQGPDFQAPAGLHTRGVTRRGGTLVESSF